MNTRRDVLSGAMGLGAACIFAGQTQPARAADARFGVSGDQFTLDGQPFQILAGEMHYPRIPRASWRDRMRKLKSLGLNTLTTYTFWNAHEPSPGNYDFSGNLDVTSYIRMAQEEGLWVNLRPGPYVCAEWDGGGLPAWLFPTPDIAPRSLDPRYMEPAKRWIKRLGQELTPLLIDNGGPIILTQIENEYGAFGNDQAYLAAQAQALRDAGFSGLLYTADPAEFFAKGSVPGVVGGINFGTNYKAEKEFATRAKVRPEGPFFCSELWGGWFDASGKLHQTMPTEPLLASLDWMLQRKYSISFYMLHGGTSFGFTPGANWNKDGYQPNTASYDYDALFDEAGRPTPKGAAVRDLFKTYLPESAFKMAPAPEASVSVPRFHLREAASIDQLLGKPVQAPAPRSLESLGQSHGLMLYRHRSRRALRGELICDDVRDYALVRSGGRMHTVLDRRFQDKSTPVDLPAGATLDILIDTMGHCNYGHNIGKDQKGLIGKVSLGDATLKGWAHYGLPLDDISALRFSARPVSGPAFYRGTFELKDVGFTFLDMRGWGKGYVWVNGHNLGRYWSVGPQHAQFVPGDWLKAGTNEVIVLDLHDTADRSLSGTPHQIWDVPGTVS